MKEFTVALRYASYGYILETGRVVMDGEAKALADENEDVKEFYLGVSTGGDQWAMQALSVVRDCALNALAGGGSHVVVDVFWSNELFSEVLPAPQALALLTEGAVRRGRRQPNPGSSREIRFAAEGLQAARRDMERPESRATPEQMVPPVSNVASTQSSIASAAFALGASSSVSPAEKHPGRSEETK